MNQPIFFVLNSVKENSINNYCQKMTKRLVIIPMYDFY